LEAGPTMVEPPVITGVNWPVEDAGCPPPEVCNAVDIPPPPPVDADTETPFDISVLVVVMEGVVVVG
jgi:hypothetical protein